MKMQTKCTPTQRAAKHLRYVAALTGAAQVRGDSYWLTVGRRNFLVGYKFVRLISHHRNDVLFGCGGPRHAEVGSVCLRITTTEEPSKTV